MVNLRQKNPWIVPTVVLILLIMASVTRWQMVASKSRDWDVLKWQRDRWTGTIIPINNTCLVRLEPFQRQESEAFCYMACMVCKAVGCN